MAGSNVPRPEQPRNRARHMFRGIIKAAVMETAPGNDTVATYRGERSVAREDIKITTSYGWNKGGRMTVPGLPSKPLRLSINWDKWRRWSYERRVVVLLHEATHLHQGNHDPDKFWEEVRVNVQNMIKNRDVLVEWLPKEIDWEEFEQELKSDAHRGNINLHKADPEEVKELFNGVAYYGTLARIGNLDSYPRLPRGKEVEVV